ncbi:MAG: hypothetical protein ACYC61_14105 [Isosphaeraceae bacterium]
MSTTAPAGEWISCRQARHVLGGCGTATIQRLALIGDIRTRAEIGRTLKYFRPDVEAVASARGCHAGNLQLAGA